MPKHVKSLLESEWIPKLVTRVDGFKRACDVRASLTAFVV